ncbi:helix-turn-helix transcriptional regulator [Nitrobacter sp.]|uniref:helix-turn-helix transcriptional regulator n=1 Tax=Nitrobacter sp. TaxID=29420 RepID=UPI003F64DFAF
MQLLSIKDVVASTRLGRSTIYRRVGEGTFPPPLKLSEGCVRWDADHLQAWRDALPTAANSNDKLKEAA